MLSFQHEHDGLTDEEYMRRLSEIKKEAETEVSSLDEFLANPEPPTSEQIRDTYNRLQAYKPLRQHFDEVLRNPEDKFADDLAEKVDLKVIIGPPKAEGHKFSAQVLLNLPIGAEEMPFPNEEEAVATVFKSSGGIALFPLGDGIRHR